MAKYYLTMVLCARNLQNYFLWTPVLRMSKFSLAWSLARSGKNLAEELEPLQFDNSGRTIPRYPKLNINVHVNGY